VSNKHHQQAIEYSDSDEEESVPMKSGRGNEATRGEQGTNDEELIT
jgi:hypothetical protein